MPQSRWVLMVSCSHTGRRTCFASSQQEVLMPDRPSAELENIKLRTVIKFNSQHRW